MCVHEAIGASSMLRLMRRTGDLGMHVVNLRFELVVESSMTETEDVLVMLRLFNS